ncbi:RHS repeat-associated core domain-containing protein [Halioxenophilus sp. WMMB6]|uniref:RHS repeat domain-containing protein n=1 Tax=Halioxenophilus sp. WMMB6 TaxID=3073815 RepID=UPI00295F0BA1|nr:RHS repeat-associated core domain-containing protein [Halioxenophilus sp. WMMB6]
MQGINIIMEIGSQLTMRSFIKIARWVGTTLFSTWFLLASTLVQADSKLYFVHNDHLGTPQVVTDQAQNVVWQADYEPFGAVNEEVNALDIETRFPGQHADEVSGLYYNYYRDYDPEIGRYIQSDPIGLNGGINTYGYVNQNPIIYTDSMGLAPDRACLIASSAAGAFSGNRVGSTIGSLLGGVGGTIVEPGGGTLLGASGGSAAGGLLGTGVGTGLGFAYGYFRCPEDPEDAGHDAADELADDTDCPSADTDRNGPNCAEIRLQCKDKCIEKALDYGLVGNNSGPWIARCETTCSSALGCSPHPY